VSSTNENPNKLEKKLKRERERERERAKLAVCLPRGKSDDIDFGLISKVRCSFTINSIFTLVLLRD
jgi:hypothetical protein